MKFSTLPPFRATGKVQVFKHGDTSPTTTIVVGCYATDAWAIGSAMERAAKWALQCVGAPAAELDKLYFEYIGTDTLVALEPRGVKRGFDEKVEAFFDAGPNMPKRATLIRQRRLLPNEHHDAYAMYAKPAAAKQEAVVAA